MNWTDDFLPLVLPSTVGVPDSLAVDHLIQAARLFCRKTLAWNYQLPTITSTATSVTDPTTMVVTTTPDASYPLPIDTGSQNLVRVLACDVNGSLYTPVRDGPLSRRILRDPCGDYLCQATKQPPAIAITPTVSAGLPIIVHIAVEPVNDPDAEWPDELEEYARDIAMGAIATLCALPKRTWTDLPTAQLNAGMFADRCSTIYQQVAKTVIRSRVASTAVFF